MADRKEATFCFDHLGGRAGHLLRELMLACGWFVERIAEGRPEYDLTEDGRQGLSAWGVPLERLSGSPRKPVVPCVERQGGRLHPYLGAHLGRLLRDRLVELGWLLPGPGRTVVLTTLSREVLRAGEQEMADSG